MIRKSPMSPTGILRTASVQKKQRTTKCKAKGCTVRFVPDKPWITWHDENCGAAIGLEKLAKIKAAKLKADRKDFARRKEAIKTPADHKKPAQSAVNRYVNLRDRDKPCISCGKSPYLGVRHASHYKARGSNSALTYNLYNINSSCYSCNVANSGNIPGYRKGIIEKYDADRLEWLDNHPRSRDYSNEYHHRIARIFTKKAKRLIKRRETA